MCSFFSALSLALSCLRQQKRNLFFFLGCPLSELFRRFDERSESFLYRQFCQSLWIQSFGFLPDVMLKMEQLQKPKIMRNNKCSNGAWFCQCCSFCSVCVGICSRFFCYAHTALVNISLIRIYFFAMRQYHCNFHYKYAPPKCFSNGLNFFRSHLLTVLWLVILRIKQIIK